MGAPNFTKNTFMWIFIIIGIIILGAIIISSITMYSNIVSLSSNVQNKLDEANILISEVNQNIDQIKKVNQQIDELKAQNSELSGKLENLSLRYPPEQTININNMNQDDFNRAINNAVEIEFNDLSKKVIFNFWVNIILSLTVGIYLISILFKFMLNKETKKNGS